MWEQVQANPKRVLIGIIIVAILLRVGASLILGNSVESLPGIADQDSYHNLAIRVLGGHGFSFGEQWWPATRAGEPTAHWSFLYTLYIAAVYAIFGPNPLVARIIQAVCVGILMPVLLYSISLRLFAANTGERLDAPQRLQQSRIIGLIAAAAAAIYVYFFYYAAALMTESFYIVGILWSVDLAIAISQEEEASWQKWLLLGVALGITVLLRQLFLLFIPFLLIWLWWAARPRLLKLALPAMVVAMMILPWTIRNYFAFDYFVLLNTNSGYAFFWGNHPIYGTKFLPILPFEMGSYYSLIPTELLPLNEAEMDGALMQIAVQNIADDPLRYVQLSISRIPPYFMFWPTADSGQISNLARMLSFALFLPFMLVGLGRTVAYRYSSWRAWLASPFTLIYLFMLVYTGIHVLTWTLIRYRLPVDAFLLIFAGLALQMLVARFTGRRELAVPRELTH